MKTKYFVITYLVRILLFIAIEQCEHKEKEPLSTLFEYSVFQLYVQVSMRINNSQGYSRNWSNLSFVGDNNICSVVVGVGVLHCCHGRVG